MAPAPRPTVAFAGAGRAAELHATVARSLGLSVVAVTSRTAERAEAAAERWGATPVGWVDLLRAGDIVVVATPAATHAPIALDARAVGAHVLVEPPLALTLDEADALVTAAGPEGRGLTCAEGLAYAPAVLELLRRLPSLGPLGHLDVRAVRPRHHGVGASTALVEVGVHAVALALLAVRPATVVGVAARVPGDEPGADVVELALHTDAGLVAVVAAGDHPAAAPRWDVEAASATGVLRLELLPSPTLEHDGEPVALRPARTAEPALDAYGYLNLWASLLEDLSRGRRPFMDAGAGRAVVEVLVAAGASLGAGGRRVPLPFDGPRDRTPDHLRRGVL